MHNNELTVVITACNRPDLLKITFDSFIKYNTFPIKKYIIIEDSGNIGINDFIKKYYPNLDILLVYNEISIGQSKSIDKAYSFVNTPYIFHLEEDWEFYDYGFIEYSMKLLDAPNIMSVWLRGDNDTNGHPIEKRVNYFLDDETSTSYRLMALNYLGIWHGFTWNPTLIKHETYKKIGKYSIPGEKLGIATESQVSLFFKNLGMRAAKCKSDGYVRHIGYGRHVEFKTMSRWEIVNRIIQKNNYENYLEIGVRDGQCFKEINCKNKTGVDPNPTSFHATHTMNSDQFFGSLSLNQKFDIIFIDGLHVEDQVDRDIENSLNHLSENGTIVLHDCNPPTRHHAENYPIYEPPANGNWNGTVYLSLMKIRLKNHLKLVTVDTDWGVGILTKQPSEPISKFENEVDLWEFFDKNREKILNLISPIQFEKIYY